MSAKKSKMPSLQFQPISMTPRDKPQKMLARFQASTFWESLTSQLPPQSLMDLTRKTKAKETSLFSILVEEPLMSHFCKSMTESLRSRPLQEILILEVKTLITSWSNTVWMNSTKRKESTLKTMPEPWDVSEHNVKKQRESWVQLLKQPLKLTLWLNLRTFPWH